MKNNKYMIILTNGIIEDIYEIEAMNQREAIILAQAKAIKDAKGYDLVTVKLMNIEKIIEKPWHKYKVKKLPKDAEYRQQSVNDDPIYYSKSKLAYYVVSK